MDKPKIQIVNFLLESDLVSLSSSLKLNKNFLHDKSRSAKPRLHPEATLFLGWLMSPRLVSAWPSFAQKHNIRLESLGDIVVFLNSIGGLRVDRSWVKVFQMTIQKMRHGLYGIRIPTLARRWPSSISGLIVAITKSSSVLLVALVIVDALSYMAGFPAHKIVSYSTIFYLIVWSSTFVHELTHILIALNHRKSYTIIQRGLRLGILHQSFANKRYEVVSSLAGPTGGILFALIPAMILGDILGDGLLVAIGLLIALFHSLSLLPMYGDGRLLLTASKKELGNNG